jgi:hypothetical protein
MTDLSSWHLSDPVLRAEIDLLGELMAATAGASRRLTSEEIDGALGLEGAGVVVPFRNRSGGSAAVQPRTAKSGGRRATHG